MEIVKKIKKLFLETILELSFKAIIKIILIGSPIVPIAIYWGKIIKFLKTPLLLIEQFTINILHLIIFIVSLILFFYLGYLFHAWKIKRRKTWRWELIKEGGVKWKIYNSFSYPNMEEEPYCPKHQIKMLKAADGFFCPDCFRRISHEKIDFLLRIVASKAEAIVAGHLKKSAGRPFFCPFFRRVKKG